MIINMSTVSKDKVHGRLVAMSTSVSSFARPWPMPVYFGMDIYTNLTPILSNVFVAIRDFFVEIIDVDIVP